MFKKFLSLFIFLLFITSPAFASGDIEVNIDKGGIYIFKIPLKKYKNKIKPYVAPELTTTTDVFNNKELNFKLVVNGGFFDTVTGKGVSEVVIDNRVKSRLFENLELAESLDRQKRLEQVLNRTEFRVLENSKDKLSFDITNHFAKPEKDNEIKHSIQAGPMIIPDLRLEEESFIKIKEGKTIPLAADVLKRRERTIIGLKEGFLNNDFLYIVIFSKSNKVALNEARDYCLKLGLNKAMAMDGGASTSINYKDIEIFSSTNNERKVKSFLVIEN